MRIQYEMDWGCGLVYGVMRIILWRCVQAERLPFAFIEVLSSCRASYCERMPVQIGALICQRLDIAGILALSRWVQCSPFVGWISLRPLKYYYLWWSTSRIFVRNCYP